MKTRQWISLLCAAALALSLAACSSTSTEDYAGQTLTGQVTAIDGSSVTLQLGELEEQKNALQAQMDALYEEWEQLDSSLG